MEVGILTAPLRKQPLDQLVPWAAQHGITALELDVSPGGHFDAEKVSDADIDRLQQLLGDNGVRISSLACYVLVTGVEKSRAAEGQNRLEKAIPLAEHMGVSTICTLAGFPTEGKNRTKTIQEDLPSVFKPILTLAAQHGVRLAIENWYATNMQHLENWRALFEALPDANLGLNFDPSHLDWQGIDVDLAVREFRERIFHVHAKDVEVNHDRLRQVGYNGDGWWRYVLPGYGRIHWGLFIGLLRQVGYDDVLSIEHEDSAFPAEEGFVKAGRYLKGLV